MNALIVDDSSFVRQFMRQQLEALGIECTDVEDGNLALDLLRGGACFDLMLVDVNMPGMSGLQCVKTLRDEQVDPAMKVMMVTTEAGHDLIEQALQFGANEFLMKPFTAQSLREKLLVLGFALAA